jgi:hypothetical protein
VRSTIFFSVLISGSHTGGAPKRSRIAAGAMRSASTAGKMGVETEDRQVLRIERERHRAASARWRQANFSLMRADLPERLRR